MKIIIISKCRARKIGLFWVEIANAVHLKKASPTLWILNHMFCSRMVGCTKRSRISRFRNGKKLFVEPFSILGSNTIFFSRFELFLSISEFFSYLKEIGIFFSFSCDIFIFSSLRIWLFFSRVNLNFQIFK